MFTKKAARQKSEEILNPFLPHLDGLQEVINSMESRLRQFHKSQNPGHYTPPEDAYEDPEKMIWSYGGATCVISLNSLCKGIEDQKNRFEIIEKMSKGETISSEEHSFAMQQEQLKNDINITEYEHIQRSSNRYS